MSRSPIPVSVAPDGAALFFVPVLTMRRFGGLIDYCEPMPAHPAVVHPDRKGTLSSHPVRVVRISANSGTDGGRVEVNSVPEIVSHTDVSGTPERSHNTGRCFTNSHEIIPVHGSAE